MSTSNTDPKALNLDKMPKPLGLREIRDRLKPILSVITDCRDEGWVGEEVQSEEMHATQMQLEALIADLERQMEN